MVEDKNNEDGLDSWHADSPVVGLTGARFGGAAGRRCRVTKSEQQDRKVQPVRAPAPTELDPRDSLIASTASTTWADEAESVDQSQSSDDAQWDNAQWDLPEQAYDLVRPYSWTGGRTVSGQELALEALISVTGRARDSAASPEHQAIRELCSTPRSVAELASLLAVPLGVVRVLLGDMVATGSVVVHDTAGSAEGAPDLALMQRVLSCLQRL